MEANRILIEYEEDDAPESAPILALVPAPSQPAQPLASPQPGLYRRFGKRTLDLALGVPLALAAAPVVAGLALAVIATSGRPAFYKARRMGRDGREFSMWKLRTMVTDAESRLEEICEADPAIAAEYRADFKLKNDSRITPFGRFLRRSSLDELPQLGNVVRGDMSLVGPRPIVRDELAHYGAHADELLRVRPGLTGHWQIGGRNDLSYPERVWIELYTCHTTSLKTDLSLLARTLMAPLRFNGR